MKKLIAILLVLTMTFAYADVWHNWFGRTNKEGVTPEMGFTNYDRGTSLGGYVDAKNMGIPVAFDKDDFLVNGVSSGRSGNFTVDVEDGDILVVKAVYVGAGFDTTDYLLISNADSNGTVLDSVNLITNGARTNAYFLEATQDSVIYFLMGDTCTVDSKFVLEISVTK